MSLNLIESFKLLRNANHQLMVSVTHQAAEFERVELKKLSETIAHLSQPTRARQLFCPAEYRQMWQAYLTGHIAKLPPRAVRYLCWEADIATDSRFLVYLIGLGVPFAARSLQGLVYSQHLYWSDHLISNLKRILIVRGLIDTYTGKNRLVNKWRESYAVLLASNSPQIIAEKIYALRQTPTAFCQEFGINEQTAFVNQMVFHLVDLFFNHIAPDKTATAYFFDAILTWQNLSLSDFKSIIERALLHDLFSADIHFREQLTNFILGDEYLGDPRLPRNSRNWAGLSEAAKTRFIQELSREDIVFFFEHVMVGYDDRHGRKNFWLQYVSVLKQSRPLLNKKDKLRLRSVMTKQSGKTLHFGETSGQYSAFLLDFGSALVIEFNGVGSVYIYDENTYHQLFPNIYANQTFTDDNLKQRWQAIAKIRHTVYWQYYVRDTLARLGIRPS